MISFFVDAKNATNPVSSFFAKQFFSELFGDYVT